MKFAPDNQRGAAAVEFGLLLPVLMLILMGAIDWGYYFYSQEVITNAAREGARAGSVYDGTGSITGVAQTAASTYLSNAGLDPAEYTASAESLNVGTPTESVRVTVSHNAPVSSVSGFLSNLSSSTLTLYPTSQQAIAEMRR